MVAPTRYFKPLVLGVLLAISAPGNTQTGLPHQLTQEDRDLVERSRSIEQDPLKILGSDWLERARTVPDKALEQAKAVHQELREQGPFVQHAKHSPQQSDAHYDTLIFISYSLDEPTLKDILAAAAGEEKTALVMRGIPEGMRLWDGLKRLQDMAAQHDPPPNIVLDPTLFEKYSVQAVPTIALLPEPDERSLPIPSNPLETPTEAPLATERFNAPEERVLLGRVEGLTDPTWLRRQIKAGGTVDQGIRGPVKEIAERDLIEVLKERVLAIDWDQKKEQTKARYWQGQRFIELPRALKAETRLIDASVVATKDIRTSEGDFVARAGDRVNPLKTRPWTQAVVVFDPLDKKQMDLLQITVPELEKDPAVAKVVLIATQFDKEKGWDSYKAVTDTFAAPVYQLTPDVKERFHLRYTPSIITANDTHFVVKELAVTQGLDDVKGQP